MRRLRALIASCLLVFPALAAGPGGNKGYVHAHLAGGATFIGRSLVLMTANGEKNYDVDLVKGADGIEYGAWLPPGDYRLISIGIGKPFDYPPVTIAPKRFTDLGSLGLFDVGEHKAVLLPIPGAAARKVQQRAIAQVAKDLADPEPLLWKVDKVPGAFEVVRGPSTIVTSADPLTAIVGTLVMKGIEASQRTATKRPSVKKLSETTEPAAFLELAMASLPPRVAVPTVDAAGNLYFGAEYGQIRVRSPKGEWHSLATGSLAAVSALLVDEDILFAGLEDGSILRSADHGATWSEWASAGRGAAVGDLRRIGGRMLVIASKRSLEMGVFPFEEDQVLSCAMDQPGTFKTYKGARMAITPGFGARTQVWAGACYLHLGEELLRYDAAADDFKVIPTPFKPTSFWIHPKTGLMTLFRAAGLWSKLALSSDQGGTWTLSEKPSGGANNAVFETPAKGFSVKGVSVSPGPSVEFQAFDGTAWKPLATGPKLWSRVLLDGDLTPTFLVSPNGSILRLENGKLELDHLAE